MNVIKNKRQLIRNGKTKILRKGRTLALEAFEFALGAVDPKALLSKKLFLKDSILKANGALLDIRTFNHIYVVGGGKASAEMAEAVESILGERITGGIVNVPYGDHHKTRFLELNEAGHPIPDEPGLLGARRMLALIGKADEHDLVICLLSGGGSSLLPLPRVGISLKDKKQVTKALLKCGAPITEINVVRKHLSAFKGGWLAKSAYPATVLSLLLSDVACDALDSIASGPTAPDPSTFADARKILEKYKVWTDAASSIRRVLLNGEKGLETETPKPGDPVFRKVNNVIIGNNSSAVQAACEYLKSAGLVTLLIGTNAEGEARKVGKTLAEIAQQISRSEKLARKPTGVILGGETTVTVKGEGMGGRNQEQALSAALNMKQTENCVISCLSTDGVDGPTDAAGAIVDDYTLQRAKQTGLHAMKFLADNDSYSFFSRLGDLIVTGQTGTNVNDISLIILL